MTWISILAWVLGGVLAAGLSFALSRIAIRLKQDIGLAVLTALLFAWQSIALVAGAAPLASATTLLLAASAIVVLAQWLHRVTGIRARTRAGLFLIAGAMWSLAATFPVLQIWQAGALASSLVLVIGGAWIAARVARDQVSLGIFGVPSGLLLAAWLALRIYASFA